MENVKKIIDLNGEYNYKFEPNLATGFGNISKAYGYIYAYKHRYDYIVTVFNKVAFNKNDNMITYIPHGVYTYTIVNDRNVIYISDYYLSYSEDVLFFKRERSTNNNDDLFDRLVSPYGWTDEMSNKLKEVILSCVG